MANSSEGIKHFVICDATFRKTQKTSEDWKFLVMQLDDSLNVFPSNTLVHTEKKKGKGIIGMNIVTFTIRSSINTFSTGMLSHSYFAYYLLILYSL